MKPDKREILAHYNGPTSISWTPLGGVKATDRSGEPSEVTEDELNELAHSARYFASQIERIVKKVSEA
jgi:hypothetical protein